MSQHFETSNTDALARRIEQTRQCPAFASATPELLERIAELMQPVSIASGQILFSQNDLADNLYVVVSGSMLLYLPWGDEELSMVTAKPGEMFGESEYFEDSPRACSARAQKDSELLSLPYNVLPGLLHGQPELYTAFVSQRLSETSRRFRSSVQRSRVAERSLQQISEFLDLTDTSALDEGSEGLIRRIVHMASKVMKADRASLFLVDHETGDLWSKVAQGEGSRRIVVPSGTGVAGWVLEHDEILTIDDVYQDERFNRSTDLETGYRTKSMICGPIKNPRGDCVGVIQVINKLSGSFSEEDVSLFRAFGHQAAVAVDNFSLFSRLRQSNERMIIMLDVLDSVTSTANMASLIGTIIEKTIKIMHCERASFFVLDRNTRELWSLKATGDELQEIRFPMDTGIGGWCASKDEIIMVDDVYDDERFNAEIDQRTGFRTKSMLAVPVHDREGRVIAVVEAINRIGGPFDAHDKDLLRAISSQIGEALKKASLLEDLKRCNLDLTHDNLTLERQVANRTQELASTNRELQLSNIELKKLNERKSEFLGIAAHDLRNPLANISSLTEVLLEHAQARATQPVLDQEQELDFLSMVRDSVRAMLRTLEDVMNTESLDSGVPAIKPESVDMVELTRRVLAMNEPHAQKKSIHISLTVEDEGPLTVNADPARIREVIDNLISNALKYSSEGKRVWVSLQLLQAREQCVRLSVKDEGPGLQSSDFKEIFGKFKKLSARPTSGESSSGLGLYIVKKLVDLHKGRVWVESIYGQGATFYVELPA